FDHIPEFFVVLQFLIDNVVQNGATFSNGIATEFCEDVWNGNVVLVANPLYVFNDLLDHVTVVVVESQRCFDREAATDIDRVQSLADLAQLTVLENKTA